MSDAPEVATTPPMESDLLWVREDRVWTALRDALNEAIEIHGDKAKAFAWDVDCNFKRRIAL